MAGLAITAGYFGARHLQRMGVAADVTEFTPADADALLYIPRVDEFTESMVVFTRGIQEAARFRELLKPETGVELGDADGLRRVGVDPEAGLVVFSRAGMAHILFGVEDAETFVLALKAKFINLGHAPARQSAPDENGVVVYTIEGDDGADHAAFAAHDGLLVLVYRGLGQDPAAGVKAVLQGTGDKGGFFETPRFKEIQAKLGTDGPLFFAAGDGLARRPDGKPRLGFLDAMQLPAFVDTFVRGRISGYLSKVSYAAARVKVEPCAANLHATVQVEDGATLLPKEWIIPDSVTAPDFGKLLPRDTVFFTRVGVNTDGAAAMLKQVSKLGADLAQFGAILGMGGKGMDPIAGLLGKFVHEDLGDKHLTNDVLEHFTGHMAVGLVGVHRKAKAEDVMKVSDLKVWLGRTVQLVGAVQLKEPKAFFDKWWAEKDVLGKFGFEIERLKHPQWQVFRLQRGCTQKRAPKGSKAKKPVCERYGVMLAGDLLVLTTGPSTLERVYDAMAGNAGSMHGLTREPLARSVMEHGPMLAGGYFSFDGLLKAVRNLNLPGGATRYLAQMYELAFTLDAAGGETSSRLLLTR